MKIGCVLVHYHTPELIGAAVEGLRSELETVGHAFEIVVVDNGSAASAAERLRGLPATVITAPGNLGYAGGLNHGLRRCLEADVFLIGNPDLEPRGCVAALLAELTSAGVVGPRFYWDRELRFLMPPADPTDRRAALLAARAHRDRGAAARARRHQRRHARRHWMATDPLDSLALSGALLAFTDEVWRRVGPFDEGFRLYFEETDWLARARRAGVRGRYVPAARVYHRHAASSLAEPAAPEWFEQSADRFRRRYFGRRFTRRLGRLAEAGPGPAREPDPAPLPRPLDLRTFAPGEEWWIEVSPTAVGFPAVAERLTSGQAEWTLPEELVSSLGETGGLVYLVDPEGRERRAFRVEQEDGEPGEHPQKRSPSPIVQ